MTRAAVHIFSPVTIWAVHFAAMYALISAACAPRGLMDIDTMTAVAALGTAAAGIGCIALMLRAGRAFRRADDTTQAAPLAQAAWWSALISLLAVMANVWPVAALPGCTG